MKRKPPPYLEDLKKLYHYDPATGNFYHKIPRGGVKGGEIAGTKLKSGRIQICVLQERYHAHRLAWYYVYGNWPIELDHKNNIPHDNRIINLRVATRQLNQANRVKPYKGKSTSLPKGVIALRRKYVARIGFNYKVIHLGCFNTLQEAEQAYKQAALKYFGEFANGSHKDVQTTARP